MTDHAKVLRELRADIDDSLCAAVRTRSRSYDQGEEQEFEKVVRFIRRWECDALRTGDDAGERLLSRLQEAFKRGEHRR